MARSVAYLCLPWPSLFLLFWLFFCSISSIQVSFSEWIVLARAASICDDRSPMLELTEEHSVGRESYDAPLWHNATTSCSLYSGDEMAFFAHFPWEKQPNSSGQNLGVGVLPFPGSSPSWKVDHRFLGVEFDYFLNVLEISDPRSNHVGIDVYSVNSTAYKKTNPQHKNLTFSISSFADYPCDTIFFYDCSGGAGPVHLDFPWDHNITKNWRSGEPTARKLLSGVDGRGTRKQHVVATRGRAARPWLVQASVVGSALIGLICAVAGLVICCIRASRRPRQSTTAAVELEDDDESIIREPQLRRGFLGPWSFSYGELAAATDNFAEERKIGRGGFGPVYRGHLSEEDRHVAIKVLSQDQSVQGVKEFKAEVTIVSQLRHRNIIQLIGWCDNRTGLALVYEFMSGGSLDTHLYDPGRHLTWSQRYKIALALGSALRYLHTDCDQCVVHGDIKPANVMLDASGNAKLGDFGLARLVDHGAEPQTTQVVAGTVGYIDPEFINSRRPSTESDVYSFGVVLLEIACGRRPASSSRQAGQAQAQTPKALLAFAREMYHRNMVLDAADRRLDGVFDGLQMEGLLVTGLWCAQQDPIRRPSITQAMDVLRSEDAKLPVLPRMPAGSGEVRSLERQAYGDLSDENFVSLSDATAYFTDEESTYLIVQEE